MQPALFIAVLTLIVTLGAYTLPVHAQELSDTTATLSKAEFSSLIGRWVRPDGGYVVTINSVNADGQLDASYANPSPLPFSRAEAARDGKETKVFLELTAGGYNGSTYTLTYDPAGDVLRGIYYQANAQESYDIYFEREK